MTLVHRLVSGQAVLDRVPAEVRPLVERCLAADPRQRPTARVLLAEAGAVQPADSWLPDPVTRSFIELPETGDRVQDRHVRQAVADLPARFWPSRAARGPAPPAAAGPPAHHRLDGRRAAGGVSRGWYRPGRLGAPDTRRPLRAGRIRAGHLRSRHLRSGDVSTEHVTDCGPHPVHVSAGHGVGQRDPDRGRVGRHVPVDIFDRHSRHEFITGTHSVCDGERCDDGERTGCARLGGALSRPY